MSTGLYGVVLANIIFLDNICYYLLFSILYYSHKLYVGIYSVEQAIILPHFALGSKLAVYPLKLHYWFCPKCF